MFEFNIITTRECNLACKYCYMSNIKEYMSIEMFKQHLNALPFILNDFNQSTYNAVFFGGEPLLNWHLIKEALPILRNDNRCNNIIIITNGTLLTKEKIEYLNKYNAYYSLSFDGLWNENNRPFKNNKSSLDFYIQNRELFGQGNSSKVMVSPSSISTLVQNYQFFVEKYNFPFPDFSLVRDDIWTEDDINLFEIECKKLVEKNIEYIKNGILTFCGFFKLAFLDIVFNREFGKRKFGCFAGVNGAAFFPNGDVYPCARFGNNNKFKLYSISNNKIEKFNNPIIKNENLFNLEKFEKCQNCQLFEFCNSGCSYEQIKEKNNNLIAEPVDSICKLYHIIYNNFLYMWQELKDNKIFLDLLKSSQNNIG